MPKLTTLTTCLFVMFLNLGVSASTLSGVESGEEGKPQIKKAGFAINVEGYDSPKYAFYLNKKKSEEKVEEEDKSAEYIELVSKWAKRHLADSREARLFEMLVSPDSYFDEYMADIRALLILESYWAGAEAPVLDIDAVMLGDVTLKSHSFLLEYEVDEKLLKKLHEKVAEFWNGEVLEEKLKKGGGLYGIQFLDLKPKGTPAKTKFTYITAKKVRVGEAGPSYIVGIAPQPHYAIFVEQKSQRAKVVDTSQLEEEEEEEDLSWASESEEDIPSSKLNAKIASLRNNIYKTLDEMGFGEPGDEVRKSPPRV